MKAVILCAGAGNAGWPEDAPPKALHHVDGKEILTQIIQTCVAGGMSDNDIRIVTGYRNRDFTSWNYNPGKPYHQLIYNPIWENGALESILCATRGIEDDSLIICGDILLEPFKDHRLIAEFLEAPEPVSCIYTEKPWGPYRSPGYNGHYQICLVKVRHHVWEEIDPYTMAEHWMIRHNRKYHPGAGVTFGAFLNELIYIYEEWVGFVKVAEPIKDVDRYYQTDEGGLGR